VPVADVRTGVRRPASFQERFERSPGGRILISLFVVVTVLTVLTANLPASRLQSLLMKADHPYLNAFDLSQNWGVFAPDPRQQTVDVFAQVTFADGSQETWHIPARNAVVGEYIDYRWRKWEEWAASGGYAFLYRPGAIYAARRLATPERRPVSVTLVDRSHTITPPGQPSTPTPPVEHTLYTTRITEAMLHGANG
jgi:hypothetical protein